MPKTMAVLDGGIIKNMIWCNAESPESDTLKDPGDRPVTIGDSYRDGKFYRDDIEILTPLEEARRELEALKTAYTEGVNSV